MKWDWNKSQLLQNALLQKTETETANGPPIVVSVVVSGTDSIGFIMLLCGTGVIFIIFVSINLHMFLFDRVRLSGTEDINLTEGHGS